MEIEIKEFGVRIRLIVEPVTGSRLKEMKETTEIEPVETEVVETEVVEIEVEVEVQRPALERALRNWRREEAVRRGVPTYIIMTERTILSIVERPPVDLEELRDLKGIGPKTMELYGEDLLNIIAETEEEAEEE